jgi:LPS-assembly protein
VEPFSKTTSSTERRPRARGLIAAVGTVALVAVLASSPGAQQADGSAAPSTPSATATETPSAATPPAEPSAEAPSPIVLEADTLEVEDEGGRVRASGNVVVEWNTSKLRAEDLRVDQKARRVEASGGVGYESDEMSADADSVTLDVDEETGVFEEVELHLAGETGRFGGDRIEKVEGRRLLLEDGYFTTCDTGLGHPPDWELRGKTLDVRMDDYARLKGGRLEVRGVPILYVPYLIFPTKQTRQSGLLSPSFGSSNRRGFLFTQPWYWAIDKQSDLTMAGIVETSARLGLDAEYRYSPSRRRWGDIHASYYNENIRGRAESQIDSPTFNANDGIPKDRGSLEIVHRERGRNWTAYADVQLVSDDLFLREVDAIDGDAPERDLRRSRRYTTSRIGSFATSGFTTGGIEILGYQKLVDYRDSGVTPDPSSQTLQEPADAWLASDGNLGPLAYAVDSSLASFSRNEGADGERLDVATTLGMPLLTGEHLLSRAWATGRASAYAMHERDVLDPNGAFVERLDAFPTRGIFEGGIDARTKLARDYVFSGTETWSGLYHSLEPFTAFRYTNRSSYDEIPLFDRLDALDGRDVASYGVDSRFLLRRRPDHAKKGQGAFELARLSLMQTYNVTRDVVDDHLSDIDLAAFLQPMEGLALRTLTSYNVGAAALRGAHASISWETGPVGRILRGRATQVAAAYRYVRSDAADILESAELLARLGITRNFSLGLKGRYDVIGKTWVEQGAGLTFTSSCDCWSVGLGVVERVNPDEFQVRVAFELRGLGGFGGGAIQRTSPALDDVEYDDVGFWRAGW